MGFTRYTFGPLDPCMHTVSGVIKCVDRRLKCDWCVGGGTPRHPGSTYFMDKVLYAYDFLLIVSSDRFTELDINLAQQRRTWQVPFALSGQKVQRLSSSIPDLRIRCS